MISAVNLTGLLSVLLHAHAVFVLQQFFHDRSREYSSEYRTEAYEDDGDEIEEEYVEETRTINERIVTKRHGYGAAAQDEYSTRRQGYGAHDEYSARRGHEHRRQEQQSRRSDMAVDYSSQDFRHSLAAIDAAARDGVVSRDGVRVRQHGDTTIMTEHRDPYSFYWQLDQHRRRSESPKRRPPPTDYVIDEEEVVETVLSPESHDSGVAFENQYSRPLRVTPPAPPPPPPQIIEEEHRPLPPGWEKHQGEQLGFFPFFKKDHPSGFSYYWHVDSGTIQREPPRAQTPPRSPSPPPPVYSRTTHSRETQADAPLPPQVIQLPPQQPVIEEHAFKQTTTKRRIENDQESEGEEYGYRKPIRFAVRSLGWTEIPEEDLTAERSSRAVNRAIVDLSTGRNDVMDNVSKWGDGRELIMELDDNELTLIDPDTMTVVHSEKIHQIRVWGVGRDNGRDFAYVARDRNSRRFMCHVFRCDTPAKTIANTLRDICKRLMMHRRPTSLHAIDAVPERRVIRTDGLPTPNEEPKKVIRCHFLGVTQVPRATGIEILNEAVDRLVSQVRPERWILADVSIAPSTITIAEVGGGQIAQCRVRYLSFLGIGRDVKHCAFIMHTSSENFMCYVFHVEPSAAAMAKTIEAACKLRYQKVLDAHAGRAPSHMNHHHDTPSIGKVSRIFSIASMLTFRVYTNTNF
ncbi:phosphotyrosine interaction domain protein [Necator americanus]|uniref:Phosphotyrosine interaction domain protein n=1 Tax=Necator americanus TaxID=51031 RepID=W2TLA2_NECAM|nr:phosphotyrosine interaction domain protein [Necator americanus]ETN82409.1 phosphotyrosine interaction domain protein [Necator americanus]